MINLLHEIKYKIWYTWRYTTFPIWLIISLVLTISIAAGMVIGKLSWSLL